MDSPPITTILKDALARFLEEVRAAKLGLPMIVGVFTESGTLVREYFVARNGDVTTGRSDDEARAYTLPLTFVAADGARELRITISEPQWTGPAVSQQTSGSVN